MKKHKDLTENFFSSWNKTPVKEDLSFLDFFSPNVISNSVFGKSVGTEILKKICSVWSQGFPDLELTHIQVEQYGNTTIANGHFKGTHTGSFLNLPATEKKVSFSTEFISYFEQQKIIRYITQMDMIDLFNQLEFHASFQQSNNQHLSYTDKALLIQKIKDSLATTLTTREVEMLSLYLIGFSAKQIGRLCCISQRTVETHLSKVLHLLECTSKNQCFEKVRSAFILPMIQDLGNLLLHNP